MKRNLLILAALALLAAGCYREPFADARITPNPALVDEEITFTNLSQDYVSSEWDLGDGTYSYENHLVISYDTPGFYDIILDAFGKKGDASRAYFTLEVKGDLKVIVKEYWDEYTVSGAWVRLYPSLLDWEERSNLVAEGYTNVNGEVVFADLQYQRYYVDVFETWHDNYLLASEDVGFIETPPLNPDVFYIFTAYVDVYDTPAEKAVRKSDRRVSDLEKNARVPRTLEEGSNVVMKEKNK